MPYISVRGFYNNNNNTKVREREREKNKPYYVYLQRHPLFFLFFSFFSFSLCRLGENNFLNKKFVWPPARARVYVQTPHTRAKKTHNARIVVVTFYALYALTTQKKKKKWLSLSWHLWLRYVLGVNVINRLVFILFL